MYCIEELRLSEQMQEVELSVILVNYNVKYFLEQALRSVFASVVDFRFEVFVVDNNSSDGSLEYLEPLFPEVCFIANDVNVGFSKANNQAIRKSSGNYILLLNPDTIIAEDTLSRSVSFLRQRADAGAVGTKMITGNGLFLPESKRGFPSIWNSFCKIFGLARLFPFSKCFAGYHLYYLSSEEEHRVEVLSGAFLMIKREVVDRVGMLDENFFMYGEDIDWSYRITLAGWNNYYLPNTILHYKGESAHDNDLRYVRIFHHAMLIFFEKHFPNQYIFQSRLWVKLGVWVSGTMMLISKYLNRFFPSQPIHDRFFIGRKEELPAEMVSEKGNLHVLSSLDSPHKFPPKAEITVEFTALTYCDLIAFIEREAGKDRVFNIYYPKTRRIIRA